jgi:hypothetical protein
MGRKGVVISLGPELIDVLLNYPEITSLFAGIFKFVAMETYIECNISRIVEGA